MIGFLSIIPRLKNFPSKWEYKIKEYVQWETGNCSTQMPKASGNLKYLVFVDTFLEGMEAYPLALRGLHECSKY